MKKIYSQGKFDGACFLYSIANAYSLLSNKEVTQSKWDEALKWIPFSGDFITDTGTIRYDENVSVYQFTIESMLESFSGKGKYFVKAYPNISDPKKIKELIKQDTLVILNIDSKHWVVMVDASDKEAQIACSYQYNELENDYREMVSTRYSRPYNDVKSLDVKKKWVHTPSVFTIRKL